MRTLSASWLHWWETQHPAALQQPVCYLATLERLDCGSHLAAAVLHVSGACLAVLA